MTDAQQIEKLWLVSAEMVVCFLVFVFDRILIAAVSKTGMRTLPLLTGIESIVM